jgi:hypothetical protein
MATTTFIPNSAQRDVNWNDPARWSGGVVPNDPTLDVIIPTITVVGSGEIYGSFIDLLGSYAIGSLSLSRNFLDFDGALTVTNAVTVSNGSIEMGPGSLLTAASFSNTGENQITGQGTIIVSGDFHNSAQIIGNGMSITAESFTNDGELIVGSWGSSPGNLTVTVDPGGFTNLSGSTLTGGTYRAISSSSAANVGALYLNVGGVIGVNAAVIEIDKGGAIYSFDDASQAYVPLTSSLHLVADSGTLALVGQTFSWSDLAVDGLLAVYSATLNATQLTIHDGGSLTLGLGSYFVVGTLGKSTVGGGLVTVEAGGEISGNGILAGPVRNDGTIHASLPARDAVTLSIVGPMTGAGTIEIGLPVFDRLSDVFIPVKVELKAAAACDVVYQDGLGVLILGDPSHYTGHIVPIETGNQIILSGISLASVTGYDYSGDSDEGTLTIHRAGGDIALDFLGPFIAGNFSLAEGPRVLSSDPPSLLITNTGRFTFAATPGDDAVSAPAGNWHFDAGYGVDTVTFSFALTAATITYSGNQVIVDGPGAHAVLTGFDTYVFSDGTVNNADGNPLVDDLFYYSQNHDVWAAHVDADAHYNVAGWREGRDPSAFFSTSFYRALNADVKAAGIDPLTHWHQQGWQEGRLASLNFDGAKYLAANPDVAAAHFDPLLHFLAAGASEGRQPISTTSHVAGNGFDPAYYYQQNPDVVAAGVDLYWHFQAVGWKEGRNPNAYFDVNGYLANYTDVKAAGINPLDHYNAAGWHEGRDPSVDFDTNAYLAANPDVKAAHINPLFHFLAAGADEGRSSQADGVWA